MRNLKHTAAALAAVVMVGSLALSQAEDLKNSYNIAGLLSHNNSDVIVYEEAEEKEDSSIIVVSEEEAQAELNEQYTPEELDTMIEEKSHSQEGFVILSSGILSVREAPSSESAVIDALVTNSTVEILESTEDWYKIRYGENNSTGYVAKAYITEDQEEAELAAKYYDNYRYGKTGSCTDSLYAGWSVCRNEKL